MFLTGAVQRNEIITFDSIISIHFIHFILFFLPLSGFVTLHSNLSLVVETLAKSLLWYRIVLIIDWTMVRAHVERAAAHKSRLDLDPEALRWSPLVGNSVAGSDDETPPPVNRSETASIVELPATEDVDETPTAATKKKRGRKPRATPKDPEKKKLAPVAVAVATTPLTLPKKEPRLRARAVPISEPATVEKSKENVSSNTPSLGTGGNSRHG